MLQDAFKAELQEDKCLRQNDLTMKLAEIQ